MLIEEAIEFTVVVVRLDEARKLDRVGPKKVLGWRRAPRDWLG